MEVGLPPNTRLSAAAFALGWLKRVSSPAPTEKFLQSITTFGLDWLIVSDAEPLRVKVAEPALTTSPAGFAWSAPVPARRNENESSEIKLLFIRSLSV